MIGVTRDGHVMTLEMQRTGRRNALNSALVDGLREAVEKAAAEDIRAIVLTGQGHVFSSGADLSDPSSVAEELPDKALALNLAIDKAPVLVIGPTSLVGNWSREIARFAPALKVVVLHGTERHKRWEAAAKADVVVTTYPVVVRDEDKFAEVRFSSVVLDEAHQLRAGDISVLVEGIDAVIVLVACL